MQKVMILNNDMSNPMKLLSAIICALITIGMYGCQSYPTRTYGSIEVADENTHVEVIFTEHDRKLIHEYYNHGKRKKTPPGLAKKKHLPPGLQKHIKKHGKLPPGLEGRHLPQGLEQTLHPLPNGYIRITVGTDVVLMEARTRIVMDLITDVAY